MYIAKSRCNRTKQPSSWRGHELTDEHVLTPHTHKRDPSTCHHLGTQQVYIRTAFPCKLAICSAAAALFHG